MLAIVCIGWVVWISVPLRFLQAQGDKEGEHGKKQGEENGQAHTHLRLNLQALVLLGRFIPYYGVVPMAAAFIGMMMTSFFTSSYLNAITSSSQRATVLSFKGMAFNLAYGAIGMGFAALIRHERLLLAEHNPQASEAFLENNAFISAIGWFPWYLALMLFVVCLIVLPRLRKHKSVTPIP